MCQEVQLVNQKVMDVEQRFFHGFLNHLFLGRNIRFKIYYSKFSTVSVILLVRDQATPGLILLDVMFYSFASVV